ncbi:hypothetical protein BKA61DRAFT_712660 [Leptodontidium sp. MPI-SDFR-AT-0119]|nr:hypothetical protein BKA61DRAFT_712660 [Leptodontidium sp. MPI-SDFR-AT-0119]
MLFSKTAILFGVLPFSLAFDCTRSIAFDWPSEESTGGTGTGTETGSGGSGGSGGSSIASCSSQCNNDSGCILRCTGNQRRSECNAQELVGSSCNHGLVRKVKNRATYSCDDGSICYLSPNYTLVCVNLKTGDYTSELGTSGNMFTGVSTPSNEVTTTVVAGDTPVETDSVQSPSSATENSKTSSVISSSSSPAPTGLSTITSAGVDAATQTSATPISSTAGGERLSAGAVVGALGLIVGFVL